MWQDGQYQLNYCGLCLKKLLFSQYTCIQLIYIWNCKIDLKNLKIIDKWKCKTSKNNCKPIVSSLEQFLLFFFFFLLFLLMRDFACLKLKFIHIIGQIWTSIWKYTLHKGQYSWLYIYTCIYMYSDLIAWCYCFSDVYTLNSVW